MKKVLTIISHDTENEVKKIIPNYDNLKSLTQHNNTIKVFRRKKTSTDVELNDIKEEDDAENILLYHLASQVIKHWNAPKFDVGTKGNSNAKENSDRWYYEKLINGNDKWVAFDEVWNYFNIKSNQDALLLARLQLLHEIYDGKELEDIEVDTSLSAEEKKAFKTYKENVNALYDNIKHIEELRKLREALLADY